MSADGAPWWVWGIFFVLVACLLTVDLFAHRRGRGESRAALAGWSAGWIALGLSFTFVVWATRGGTLAQEYLGVYLLEKSLSLDNMFVFLLIYRALRIPPEHQHQPLYWGVVGALVFRAIAIFLGAAAIARWHWLVYVFGGALLITAVQAARKDPTEEGELRWLAFLSRHVPVTDRREGTKLFVRLDGKLRATPVALSVIAIEIADIGFAIDSVPAAFSISRNEFVIYTANAFAIMGLRALYLFIAATLSKLRYLHYGLAVVLAFAGFKMILGDWVEVHPLVSVAVIVVTIGIAIGASVIRRRRVGTT